MTSPDDPRGPRSAPPPPPRSPADGVGLRGKVPLPPAPSRPPPPLPGTVAPRRSAPPPPPPASAPPPPAAAPPPPPPAAPPPPPPALAAPLPSPSPSPLLLATPSVPLQIKQPTTTMEVEIDEVRDAARPLQVSPTVISAPTASEMGLVSEDLGFEEVVSDEVELSTDPESIRDAAEELVRSCEVELKDAQSPRRAARLHYEIARTCEFVLGDARRAAAHYHEALKIDAEHLPTVRGARRIFIARRAYAQALPLFDAEIRATADPAAKAALLFEKARILEDHIGRRKDAREALLAALELDRTNLSLLLALELMLVGDRDDPELLSRVYERQANAASADPRYRAALVVARARLAEHVKNMPDHAVELYETALRLDPDAPFALDELKRLHHHMRRWRDLVTVLAREAELATEEGERAMAFYRIGRIQAERLGARDEAVVALERAAADGADPLVLHELARLYELAGDYEPLTGVLERIAELTPDTHERLAAYHRVATLLEERLGRPGDAVSWYEAALDILPTHVPSLQALGRLYAGACDWERLARMHLREADATEEPRRKAAALVRVAEILESELGKPAEAAEQHARALTAVPLFPPAFKALTRLYAAARRWRELVELYEMAVDRSPPVRAVAYLQKIGSICEDHLGDFEQAAHAFRRVLDLDGTSLGAIHDLQRVCERAGRWQDLVRALELEVERTPTDADLVAILERIGEVYEEKIGDRDAALAAFRRALSIDERFLPGLKSLGRIYFALGRWEDLLDVYRRELDVTPRGAETAALLFKMGELCEERIGRDDEAIRCWRQALEADPAYQPALRALARKLRDRGEHAALAEVLAAELSTITDPSGRALAHYRIGEIHEEHLGRLDDATAAYEASLRALPGYRPASDALLRLRALRGQWKELVDQLAAQARLASSDRFAVRMWLQQAQVWWERLDEPLRTADALRQVLVREPGSLGALTLLQHVLRRIGHWEDLARTHAALARTLADAGARVAQLRELSRLEEAARVPGGDPITTNRAILGLSPDDPLALAVLERHTTATGDLGGLVEVLQRQAQLARDPALEASLRTRLGEVREVLGDDQALEDFRTALARDPENLAATRGLARIAERTGDPTALSEAARREAAVSRDTTSAARLLVRSAAVLSKRLHDDASAVRDLERALELDPDSEDAVRALTTLQAGRGEHAKLLDALSRAASAARDPMRVAALWMQVAALHNDPLGNVQGAVGAYHRVLRASPDHVGALRGLADVFTRDGQWNEAAALLTRVIQLSPERTMLRDAHLALATLQEQRLSDPARAVVSLQGALALDPEHEEALERLAELLVREGQAARAADAAARLVRAARSDAKRIKALLLLSEIRLGAIGDVPGAVAALREAVLIEGTVGKSAARLRKVLGDRNEWGEYAAVLRDYVGRPTTAGDRSRAELELANVLEQRLGRIDEAAQTLQRAVRTASETPNPSVPEVLALRTALAGVLRRGGRVEEAIAENRRILQRDPAAVTSVRELRGLFEARGRLDEVACADAVLVALGGAEPAQMQSYRERAMRPLSRRAAPLDPGVIRELASDPAERVPAAELLAAVSDHLGKVYPPDLEGLGLTSRDRIGPRDRHALRGLADQVAATLGVGEYNLYVHQVRGRGVVIENDSPLAIAVPSSLGDASDREQTFVLSRAFCKVATRHYLIEKLTPRELEVLLAAVARTVAPGVGAGLTAEDFLEDLSKRIQKALPRKARPVVSEAATRYVSSPRADFVKLVRAIDRTAVRVAAVMADDLPAALNHLAKTDRDVHALLGQVGKAESAMHEMVRAVEALSDPVRWFLGDDCFALRKRLWG